VRSLVFKGTNQQQIFIISMAEDLHIITGTKTEVYQSLLPQIKALVEGEPDLIANLANIAAALKEQFGWLWVGFGAGSFPGAGCVYTYQ
jgi:putative methionine-R-sulfoxide reductase with GAF domain